ncbi:gluconeogenesis factor YvcK family protein [Desulfogranum japonicum]|uniref:gluconeogenesis factor YvcK family protein n=1 Tax=Desulfogranum japonicum TaxID=231447 RepID=UPI00040E4F3F|nr:gluconeogenesis factor YvcK family protein [Desulfogranum japonicum]
MENHINLQMQELTSPLFSALDFLPGNNCAEKVTSLLLENGNSLGNEALLSHYAAFVEQIRDADVSELCVVVLGGGTGLSNLVGGDSRQQYWRQHPFSGMKEVFPHLHAVVCVTDDGGSTGELLKDLPLIALGDLRHVLLSSVRKENLIKRYGIDEHVVSRAVEALFAVMNYRFISHPVSSDQLLVDTCAILADLPPALRKYIEHLTKRLFTDIRLQPTLYRTQCLGNLLLAAAIYDEFQPHISNTELIASHQLVRTATIRGLQAFSLAIGAGRDSVLPCTTTLSQIQMLYDNGVLVTSEDKSSKAQRGYAVDRVLVDFSNKPYLLPEVVQLINKADIIVFAPGSLYTSIIPILQIPGMAEAIRRNTNALKLLVANIWVQRGETDLSKDTPDRKFHVSDLIHAYQRNIPDGIKGLFSHILGMKMKEIPGSTLQRYALEEKQPIYLDRKKIRQLGLRTVEARLYSEQLLLRRGIIQHDSDALAMAIKTLWILQQSNLLEKSKQNCDLTTNSFSVNNQHAEKIIPCLRFEKIRSRLKYLSVELINTSSSSPQVMPNTQQSWLVKRMAEILWLHPDILVEHLQYVRGITLIAPQCWKRCQEWDNVFSFYDPQDAKIKIRQDQVENLNRFEIVFLIALGQSLLGNYADQKIMLPVVQNGLEIGRMYQLTICESQRLRAFLSPADLHSYLELSKMTPMPDNEREYYRVIHGQEGFTPPGLFFGLFYAWYLDNRFAPNIDYNMSIMKHDISDLIPEQIRLKEHRQNIITFFRERVFRQQLPYQLFQPEEN